MSDDTPQEAEVREFFEAVDLKVDRIPAGEQKTPDFLVTGEGPGYLVEVKTREDDAEIERELSNKGAAQRTRPVGYEEMIARIARKARKQLETYDEKHTYQWLIWFSTDTVYRDTQLTTEQILCTLYGVRSAVYARVNGKAVSVRCFYARPGPFERWPEIDGALISSPNKYQFCANEFSPRVRELVGQGIPKRFAERGALVVPADLEERGGCLIASLDIERRSEEKLRDHLRGKYNHPELQIVDFKSVSVVAALDPES